MGNYDDSQLAVAATEIAADLARKVKFGPPAVSRNLGLREAAISDRGIGFRGPQLSALVPWRANAATRDGAMFDSAGRLVRRRSLR